MFPRRLAAVIAVASLCSCAFTQSGPIRETTICELVESGEAMNDRAVRLRAIYITDLKHTTILKDRQCKSVTLSVLDAEGQQLDPSLEKFDEAVWGEIDDLDLRIFLIDASGVFAWQPRETPRSTFTIQKIWDFKRLHGDDWRTAE